MQAKYLPVHNRRVHGLDEGQVCIPAPTRDQGQVYTIDFPRTMRKASCPVPECPGTATSWWSMRRHFVSRHPVDSVHIRQEGPRPLPKCTRCGMQLPSGKLTSQHYSSRLCVEGQARRQQREALNQIALANEQEFTIYGEFCNVPQPSSISADRCPVWTQTGRRCIEICGGPARNGQERPKFWGAKGHHQRLVDTSMLLWCNHSYCTEPRRGWSHPTCFQSSQVSITGVLAELRDYTPAWTGGRTLGGGETWKRSTS